MANTSGSGFESLFNGKDLSGWIATPRTHNVLWPEGRLETWI